MTLDEKLSTVPAAPGVYLFKDRKEKILYVGKAKSLRQRLRSYFRKSADLDERKQAMVRQVADFSWLITDSELEALALEANLIKQHKPRFNVILRDDKNYPYIKLTVGEEWPRLEVVRRIVHDGSLYFGPFVPAGAMWEMLAFIRRHFNIRPCRYRLDRPMRPCIESEMGRCPAPCDGRISKEEYMKNVSEVRLFLEGQKTGLVRELETRMQKLSEAMLYEQAAVVRDKLDAVRRAWDKQKVISPELGDMDIIGCICQDGTCAFQVFFIRKGLMIGNKDFYLKKMEGIAPEELTRGFLEIFYSKELIPPDEILLRTHPLDEDELSEWLSGRKRKKTRFIYPQRGKKRELLEMAEKNAAELLRVRRSGPEHKTLEEIKERLSLKRVPESIGAFDVSTIQGAYPVGAFVCWAEGGFRKEFYRHVKIRETEDKSDDYAMMAETVRRVLTDLAEERPELIVIDGGRGQLEAARAALENIEDPPEIIALAKDPDRVFIPDYPIPVDLEDGRPSSLLLKRIRDEVHRFAITFHKKLRGKGLLESPLLQIKGIGNKKRLELLRHFGSIEALRAASEEELVQVKGIDRGLAHAIKEFLKKENSARMEA